MPASCSRHADITSGRANNDKSVLAANEETGGGFCCSQEEWLLLQLKFKFKLLRRRRSCYMNSDHCRLPGELLDDSNILKQICNYDDNNNNLSGNKLAGQGVGFISRLVLGTYRQTDIHTDIREETNC